MGTDGEVVIPVRLSIEESEDYSGIRSELDRLKRDFEEIQKVMDSNWDKVSEDQRKSIERGLIQPIAEVLQEFDRLESEVVNVKSQIGQLQSLKMRVGKVLGGGTDSGVTNMLGIPDENTMAGIKASIRDLQNTYTEAVRDVINYTNQSGSTLMENVSTLNLYRQAMETSARTGQDFATSLRILTGEYKQNTDAANANGSAQEQAARAPQVALEEYKRSIEDGTRALEDQERQATKTGNSSTQASNKAASANAKAAAQVYYLVRSFKMLGEVFEHIKRSGETLLQTMKNLGYHVSRVFAVASAGLLDFNKQTRQATSESKNLGNQLAMNFKTFLKYTFGVRSMFALFRKLRSAVIDSLGQMSIQYSAVNKQMSSLMTNITWMKNSLATAIQPLLTAIVPIVEKIAVAFNRAAIAVGSFIAALTGQKFVYNAVKVQQDYAASLTKTSKESDKAAKKTKKLKEKTEELRKELSDLDKLNVLHSDKDDKDDDAVDDLADLLDDLEDAGPNYFNQMIPIAAANEWADKVKDILSRLFYPLKEAWNREGKFVMDSWKYALQQIWKLIRDVGADFLTVWDQENTVQIFSDILHVIGDIGKVVGNLAKQFREAWNENNNGKKILEGIRDLILVIAEALRRMADYTVEWSDSLDFTPLLQSLGKLIEDLKDPLESVMRIVEYFYENVVLKFVQYLIEKGFPRILDAVDRISKKIDWDHLETKMKELMDALEPFLEKVWEALAIVFEKLGTAIADFINSEKFDQLVDTLIRWMEDADPATMALRIEQLVKAFIGFKVVGAILMGGTGAVVAIGSLATALMNIGKFLAPLFGTKGVAAAGTAIAEAGTAAAGGAATAATAAAGVGTAAEAGAAAASTAAGAAAAGAAAAEGGAAAATAAGAATVTAAGVVAAGAAGVVAGGAIIAVEGAKTNSEIKKNNSEQLQATQSYIESLRTIYEQGGQNAVNAVTGTEKSMSELRDEAWERYDGDIDKVDAYMEELNRVYEEGGNQAVSTVEGYQTTLDEAIDAANERYQEQPKNLKESLEQSTSLLKDWFEGAKADIKAIGDKIVEQFTDTGEGIPPGFKMGLEVASGKNPVQSFIDTYFGGFVKKVKEGIFGEHSPSKVMADIGENAVQGFIDGSESKKGESESKFTGLFQKLIDSANSIMKSDTLSPAGSNLVTGVMSGMEKQNSQLQTTSTRIWDTTIQGGTNRMSDKALYSAGANLVTGLVNGVIQAYNNAKATLDRIWQSITEAARACLGVHSPSTVFFEIGQFVTEGLVGGIEKDTDEVGNAFEEMIPNNSFLTEFSDNFTSTLARMREDSVKIVDNMVYSMNKKFANLDDVDDIMRSYSKIGKLEDIKLPKILMGGVLPSNKEFTKSSEDSKIDMKKLPSMMKEAFISALKETSDMTEDGDIIINIDGREVFKVVKSQNAKYKKQYGVSAFV